MRIKFDSSHNPIEPTIVLATRSGRKICKLPALNLKFGNSLMDVSELFFKVSKDDCVHADNHNFIHKSIFALHNNISLSYGYDEIGMMTAEQRYELDQYTKLFDDLANVKIKLSGSVNRVYDSPSISISDDGSEILLHSGGINIIKISNTSVFLADPAKHGLSRGSSCLLEFLFDVPVSAIESDMWDQITDFKLAWVKEWDRWFEINVEISEDVQIVKNITAKSLGASELSQINVYGININNESDILRDDYEPATLFNEKNHSASLLHRILKKAPHYTIGHVDSSIANLQRTFQFDNISIYDALQEISEEIKCFISIECKSDAEGKIVRVINAYDLESYCLECGARGSFVTHCDKCGSENILTGYGEDTSVYVSVENLAEDILYKTDTDSVKNCFRIEGGDELMTATVANCNPNGTNYIWYISDSVKADMSLELQSKLNEYDSLYSYYQKEYQIQFPDELFQKYNAIVDKYQYLSGSIKKLTQDTIGYSGLMQTLYDSIDLYYFLNNSMMPSIEISKTNAEMQAAMLNHASLSPIAVKDLKNCSLSTANSAALAMAKTVVDPRYQVKIKESSMSDGIWSGVFTVTNYSDEEDTADSVRVNCSLSGEFKTYISQRIKKILSASGEDEDITDISGLFKLPYEQFVEKLKQYSLQRLNAFRDCCQNCLDMMIQQGLANSGDWEDKTPDLYSQMYVPYYEKLGAIEAEIIVRESEIAVVIGKTDNSGTIVQKGIQDYIESQRSEIQSILNFEEYLGDKLFVEFAAYRREDTISNPNFISDGLDNKELFEIAQELIDTAKSEIFKSATLQHSIEASLKNLLMMKEFQPIVEHFELGNWIRIRVDSKLYKLRIIYYEIDFDDADKITIEFSDVQEAANYIDDTKSLLDQMSSIATSYGAVVRQAKKGEDSNKKLANWVNDGLALTKMKIIDSADNQNITWDSHGLLCREYLPITDNYDDKQLKIINRGLYVTDDNWRTSRAGIGDFTFYNPKTKQHEYAYGVIADLLVGSLVLSEEIGIYNENNSLSIDTDGFVLTSYADGDKPIFTIQRENDDGSITKLLHLDEEGRLLLNGSISIGDFGSLDDMANGITDANDKADLAERRSVVDMSFQYASSSSGTIQPSTGWQDTVPSVTPGHYLWTKTTYTYGDGTTRSTYTVSRQGIDGTNGTDGSNGNDGLNTATIMLFKRSDSLPSKPSVNITYTFSTSSFSSNLSGWNTEIPSGTSPCYVIRASIASTGTSIVITPGQWSEPVIFVQNGVVDYSGINERFDELSQSIYDNLENYKPAIDQYMSFDSVNGLILGSKEDDAQFKVQITNNRIAFIENDDVTAYINSNQLYITNAVITSSLYVGGYYFTPLFTNQDGEQKPNGMAIVWKGDIGIA